MYGGPNMMAQPGYGSFGEQAYATDPNALGMVMGADMMAGQKAAFAPRRRSMNLAAVVACVMVPFFIFAGVFSIQSFSMHYTDPDTCRSLSLLAGGFVLLLGWWAFRAYLRRGEGTQDPKWYTFVFVTSALAWVLAMAMGGANFKSNTNPYYDIVNLNVYTGIDPAKYRGQQLMDAGRIVFEPGSHLEISRSMGFKNLDTYCVAPVVNHRNRTMNSNVTGASGKAVDEYDFWAVGLNCCSGHQPDFHCGEYNNLNARSGLRLMRDDYRSYFRLAVQQAEAAYGIKASHPIFMYWMQDPSIEVNAYQDDAYKMWLTGIGVFFGVQLLMTIVATVSFSKLG